jgi:hypothetical protein
MSDSVLKKEFQKRDVERLRNLVAGKHGSKTTVGVGYQIEQEEIHKEGDIWENKGKTWTIRDGIRENVTKLDKFKQAAVPLFCPKCKQYNGWTIRSISIINLLENVLIVELLLKHA